MVSDRSGETADSLDMLLIVHGEAGCPNTRKFPKEIDAGGDGIGGHSFEDGSAHEAFEFWFGQPCGKSLAYSRAVKRPSGSHLLHDADGTFGFPLRYDRHNPVSENRETCTFARAVAQFIQKGHGNFGELFLAPGSSRELKELGRERIGPGVSILNKITELNERTKKMMGCTPGQIRLPCDLGKGRRAADGGYDFKDPESPFQGLIGLVYIHALVALFHFMKL